jgi:hypothetical protein
VPGSRDIPFPKARTALQVTSLSLHSAGEASRRHTLAPVCSPVLLARRYVPLVHRILVFGRLFLFEAGFLAAGFFGGGVWPVRSVVFKILLRGDLPPRTGLPGETIKSSLILNLGKKFVVSKEDLGSQGRFRSAPHFLLMAGSPYRETPKKRRQQKKGINWLSSPINAPSQ